MSTLIKSELSKKNVYWIEKHRYYELKHFCLQYPIFKKAYAAVDSLSHRPWDAAECSGYSAETIVERATKQAMYYSERMRMIELCCQEANPRIAPELLIGVTEEVTYDILCAKHDLKCSRDEYYISYRRFFWLLNKTHF